MADTETTIKNATNTQANAGTLDKLTGTSAEDRQAFIAKAQERVSDAVTSAVDAVKANPKTAAAIAAGATAAVAGAAYGATKLAKGSGTSGGSKRGPAKGSPAARK